MKTPTIPSDEGSRLTALRSLNILDTPQEERFDRLTRMAKRIFNVSIALVSLVDENRQWFKSSAGLSASETPRDISFCGHAILGDDIFLIPDTMKDERFNDNPLVLNEPNIRFYAGCPLRALDGSKIGTLCIIDQKPKVLSEDDLENLKDIASMAERELAAIQLAIHDELTNIPNRRGFVGLAQNIINLCVRHKMPATLVFFDLDKFKQINDQYGHAEGDKALIAFVSHVRNVLRDSDIIARVGGDEFVALLAETSKESAENVMQRCQEMLDSFNQEQNCGYEISFSHGVVEFNMSQHQTLEELMAAGDSLMYARKQAKRIDNQ